MNLKAFHIVFVTCSTLLAFGMGGWFLSQDRGTSYSVMGVLALLVGIGLIVYGIWFWRKITTPEEERERRRKLFRTVTLVLLAGLALLVSEPSAWACSVCYGEAEGPLIDAARLGVYLLFGLVFAVQASFVAFFVVLWRRARRYRQERAAAATTLRPALRSH